MSKYCASCGASNADDSVTCVNCGAVLENNPSFNSAPMNAAPVNPVNQGYNAQPYAVPVMPVAPDTTTGIGGWIGWLILCSFFPVIGQLIMLTSKDSSAKNFAKAQLILALIGIVAMILLVVVAGVSVADILNS